MNRKKTNKKHDWDDPKGLGWQLWRRVHNTGLLRFRIQRNTRRSHRNMLIARASLMKDIHRRWGLDQSRAFSGYNQSFPLVIAHFPPVSPGTQFQDMSAPSRAQGPQPPVSMPVSPSRLSGLSRTSKSTEALGKLHTVQRRSALDIGHAAHGPKRGIDIQKLVGPAESDGYYAPEVPEKTPAVQTTDPTLSAQRSELAPADEVNASGNDIRKPIDGLHSNDATEVNLQRSGQNDLATSVPTSVVAGTAYKKITSEPIPAELKNAYSRRTSPSTTNRNVPSAMIPITRISRSSAVQSSPPPSRDNPLFNVFRQHHIPLVRSERRSQFMPQTSLRKAGGMLSRSKAGTALGLPRLSATAVYSGAHITPLHRKITEKPNPVFGADESITVISSSPAIAAASSSTQSPVEETAAQTKPFHKTLFTKSVSSSPITGPAPTFGAATGIWAMRAGPSPNRLQGHRHAMTSFTHQPSPLSGPRALMNAKTVFVSSPLSYLIPVASMSKATRPAKVSLKDMAGGGKAESTTLAMPAVVSPTPIWKKARPARQSDRVITALHDDHRLSGDISIAPAISATLTGEPSERQAQHQERGRPHGMEMTREVAGENLMPQTVEPAPPDRSTLFRQHYHPAKAHQPFITHPEIGTAAGSGAQHRDNATPSLTPMHVDRVTHLKSFKKQPKSAMDPFSTTGGIAPLLRVPPKLPYDAMRLAMPTSKTVQRQVADHAKGINNGFPLSSIKDSGSVLSAVGKTGAVGPKTYGDTNSLHLNFSADPPYTSFSGFESGHSLFRCPVSQPMVTQAVSKREASHAAGTDRRPDPSSGWRTALLRHAGYPGLILRQAAGKDTRSGGPATPEFSKPIGSWPVTRELLPSLPLKLLRNRSEASPMNMMDKIFHERTALRRQAVYPGTILRLAAGKVTRSGGSATPEISTSIGSWPVTPELSPSLPLKLLRNRSEASPAPMMGRTSHEMPLFFMSGTESRNSSISNHHTGRPVVQNNPLQLLDAPTTAITSAAGPSVINEETTASEKETSAAQARIDPDELVEKIWRKIMRKLTIEQERKGCPRWR